MSGSSYPTKTLRFAEFARLGRRCVCYLVLAVCAYTGVHAAVEPFHIPSGSMAPTFHGRHRACACPRCGQEVIVGCVRADVDEKTKPRSYRKAFCQNCGLFPVPIADAPAIPGDKIVVNKTAHWLRTPQRWEIAVFRLLGTFFIKRILGLPGEEILIHDGDLYVNGQLARKSIAEVRSVRVLIFEDEHAPPGGWKDRWEMIPPSPPGRGAGREGLTLDSEHTLTYRNYSLDEHKCEPIRDEYAYNAGLHADSECVHDFLVDTEIEATAGQGSVALRLCDGHDWIEVLLPVGKARSVEAFAWPIARPEQRRKLTESAKTMALTLHKRQRVELAFVDRRVTLAVDGQTLLSADLPEAKDRQGVERPFQAHADGARAVLHRFRLYRDVHYGQQGTNGVRGKSVRLGVNQYFMLGDNSPSSEDSRFWPDDGRVNAAAFVGSVLLRR